jgi:hypothetical protein
LFLEDTWVAWLLEACEELLDDEESLRAASDEPLPTGAATTDPARATIRGRTATLNNIVDD